MDNDFYNFLQRNYFYIYYKNKKSWNVFFLSLVNDSIFYRKNPILFNKDIAMPEKSKGFLNNLLNSSKHQIDYEELCNLYT